MFKPDIHAFEQIRFVEALAYHIELGSGAVAVLVVGEEFSQSKRRKILGGVTQNAPEYHALCRWGMKSLLPATVHTVERVFGQQAGALVQKSIDFAAELNWIIASGLVASPSSWTACCRASTLLSRMATFAPMTAASIKF